MQHSSSARARRLVTRSSHLLADTRELAVSDGAGLLLERSAVYAPRLCADELATRSGSVDAIRHTTRHEAGRLQRIDDIAGTRHGGEGTPGSNGHHAMQRTQLMSGGDGLAVIERPVQPRNKQSTYEQAGSCSA